MRGGLGVGSPAASRRSTCPAFAAPPALAAKSRRSGTICACRATPPGASVRTGFSIKRLSRPMTSSREFDGVSWHEVLHLATALDVDRSGLFRIRADLCLASIYSQMQAMTAIPQRKYQFPKLFGP